MSITRESTSRTVRTTDWNLHYHEAGSGHPLILLHGSGPGATGWSNFSGNLPGLAQRFRVLAVDMPGWGASDACPVDRLEHVDAALQFMDALGIERAAVVGNSMGGITAVRLAAEHPDRISHLITMGPASSAPRLFGRATVRAKGSRYCSRLPDANHRSHDELVNIMFRQAFRLRGTLPPARRGGERTTRHLKNFLAGLSRLAGASSPATPADGHPCAGPARARPRSRRALGAHLHW